MRSGIDFRQVQNPGSLFDSLPPIVVFAVADEPLVNLNRLPFTPEFQLAHCILLLSRNCHGILDYFDEEPDSAVISTGERLDCFGAHAQHVAVDDEKEKRDVEELPHFSGVFSAQQKRTLHSPHLHRGSVRPASSSVFW